MDALENGLKYVAACVAAGDEALLPLFERLEEEVRLAKKAQGALERARLLAR